MIKIDSMVIEGRKINLAFDTAAMMATEERFESVANVTEAINADSGALKAKMDLVTICAAGGERHKPTDEGAVDDEWIMHNTCPHELDKLVVMAVNNAVYNMTGKERKKDEPVDVVLEEIEGKNVQS